jgi:hypothetical protein
MAEQAQPTWNQLQVKLIAKAWKDAAFKQELLRNPKAVLEHELSTTLPTNLEVQVLEVPHNTRILVLPPAPDVEELGKKSQVSDEDLESLAAAVLNIPVG